MKEKINGLAKFLKREMSAEGKKKEFEMNIYVRNLSPEKEQLE